MIRTNGTIRGMTLIDAIMVLVTGGLLVALLAPMAARGRQESHIATCLANLRQISQAAAGYATQNGTIVFAYPFGYKAGDYQANFNVATEFIWGGGVPDKRAIDWDESWGLINPADVATDTYCIVPADRPLNEYMVPGVWWSDPLRYWNRPERRQIPMELPDFFKCPDDAGPAIPGSGADPDPNTPIVATSWEWWGTSYAVNWYWALYEGETPGAPNTFNTLTSAAYGEALFAEKTQRGASEFVLFYENGLNFAFGGAYPRGGPTTAPLNVGRGWHGHPGTHAAGFADGSARYQQFDTRYIDGPGWTTWPNRPWNDYWAPYEDN